MNPAPTSAATVPGRLTPPDVPVGTGRPVMIDRGGRRARVPTSVAQVSEVAAASAPAPKALHALEGQSNHASAASAKRPPFARTWRASRSPPFATIAAVRSSLVFSRWRERALEAAKNRMRSAPQLHPAAIPIVPRAAADTAPLGESARARRAANAMAAARSSPAPALTRSGDTERRSSFAGKTEKQPQMNADLASAFAPPLQRGAENVAGTNLRSSAALRSDAAPRSHGTKRHIGRFETPRLPERLSSAAPIRGCF
jgi:hypothetical protein